MRMAAVPATTETTIYPPASARVVPARDTEGTILQLFIIGLALAIAGIASLFAIGRMMSTSGAHILALLLGGTGGILILGSLLLLGFYRDPDRHGEGGLLSPADGKVVLVDEVDDEELGPTRRIAVFMSPLDVHVNRVPTSAELLDLHHHPGGYVPAFRKESERNERLVSLWCATGEDEDGLSNGTRFKLVQIAGAMARRIVCWEEPGARLERGARYGIIKLGSRVDLYLPKDVEPQVRPGDRVKAGSTVVARPARTTKATPSPQENPLPQAS